MATYMANGKSYSTQAAASKAYDAAKKSSSAPATTSSSSSSSSGGGGSSKTYGDGFGQNFSTQAAASASYTAKSSGAAAPAPAKTVSETTKTTGSSVGSNQTQIPTKIIQQTLGVTADGSYGPNTTNAVKAFQAANGLKADGIVGPATSAALLSTGKITSTDSKAKVGAAAATATTGDSDKADIMKAQKELNEVYGAGIAVDGIWGPESQAAYDKFTEQEKVTNPVISNVLKTNSAEALAYAERTGDYSGLVNEKGQPFSIADQQQAERDAQSALDPYYSQLATTEQQDAEAALQQKQRDYQDYLDSQSTSFAKDKTELDQSAANSGVLFSGGRIQKQQALGDAYAKDQASKFASQSTAIGDIARGYQQKYGDTGANKLTNYFKLGQNNYNPNVAQGGVSAGGLSSVYNPTGGIQGSRITEKKSEVQKRAAGLLYNKASKLTGAYQV